MTEPEKNALKSLLQNEFSLYPKAEARDILKLIYQSTFGCAHLVEDEQKSLERIAAESGALLPGASPVVRDIGGGFCRLSLVALKEKGLSAETLNRLFLLSSRKQTGSKQLFLDKAAVALKLCQKGELAIAPERLERELALFEKSGGAPFSHSETFRAAYSPAYRVVEKCFCDFLELFCRIDTLLSKKGRLTAAIDGRCGSGKSTLARLLQQIYRCAVIPMDDFFLQPHQRTAERLGEPGGNLDRERILSEIMPHLNENASFGYRPYICSLGALGDRKEIPPSRLLVLEGSYSLHPELKPHYGLTVFLTVSPEAQKERISARSGEALLKRFETEWIPLEEKYFSFFKTKDCCDLVFDTTEMQLSSVL